MILSYPTLLRYWKDKRIVFKPDISEGQIGESSIDLRLGTVKSKLIDSPGITIRPAVTIPKDIFTEGKISKVDCLKIKPKELVLVLTMEAITLPADLCADVQGKSSFARYGLATHITSPHIHPLFSGRITLELFNHSGVEQVYCPGDRICQVIFSELTEPLPLDIGKHKGRYMGQKTPTPDMS